MGSIAAVNGLGSFAGDDQIGRTRVGFTYFGVDGFAFAFASSVLDESDVNVEIKAQSKSEFDISF